MAQAASLLGLPAVPVRPGSGPGGRSQAALRLPGLCPRTERLSLDGKRVVSLPVLQFPRRVSIHPCVLGRSRPVVLGLGGFSFRGDRLGSVTHRTAVFPWSQKTALTSEQNAFVLRARTPLGGFCLSLAFASPFARSGSRRLAARVSFSSQESCINNVHCIYVCK